MKSTICALVILVILIGGGIIFSNELDDFSSELIALTNEVYMLSVGGDYDTAKKQLDRVDELLEEKKVLIGSMIDHAEFEKIELNFQRLRVYVSEQIPTQIKTYCNVLNYQIELLPKDYMLKPENIL